MNFFISCECETNRLSMLIFCRLIPQNMPLYLFGSFEANLFQIFLRDIPDLISL